MTDNEIELLEAAKEGNIAALHELLSNDVNIIVTDEYGRSALYITAEMGRMDAMQLLVGNAADANPVIYGQRMN